jgi:undecaprenyl diphosphate synthase
MSMKTARLDVIVRGKVQGVRFRASARNEARKLGINGYAKNLPDDGVEIVAEGPREKLGDFLQWCMNGPFLANVKQLTFNWGGYSGEFQDFAVVRDKKGFIVDQLKAFKVVHEDKLVLPEGTIVPKHIAIIPDGNRRWAKANHMAVAEGHRNGFENLIEVANAARDLGIRYLTVWGFSTENWTRNKDEVENLMKLFLYALKRFENEFHDKRIRFKQIGRKDRFNEELLNYILKLEKETASYDDYYLNIALDYGGQNEIIRSIQKAVESGIKLESITPEEFNDYTDTAGQPDPDFIIRTSGEMRLSGLMPWQSTYAELYFATMHFPDFDKHELKKAIVEFSNRNRRFGK